MGDVLLPSKEAILNHLPRSPMIRRRGAIPREQGIYFFIAHNEDLYYIGSSIDIAKRIMNVCDHPLWWYLCEKIDRSVPPSLRRELIDAEFARVKELTTVAWFLLPGTRQELFSAEYKLISRHKPALNKAGVPWVDRIKSDDRLNLLLQPKR